MKVDALVQGRDFEALWAFGMSGVRCTRSSSSIQLREAKLTQPEMALSTSQLEEIADRLRTSDQPTRFRGT